MTVDAEIETAASIGEASVSRDTHAVCCSSSDPGASVVLGRVPELL